MHVKNAQSIVVIGAGPAGMMAAGTAGERGVEVLLVEKNLLPGRKLLLTGNGRCNFTHTGSLDDLVANVITNGKFLYNAFAAFSNQDTIGFFRDRGLTETTEPDGRVFPASGRALDVSNVLQGYCRANGVKILTAQAAGIKIAGGRVNGILFSDGKEMECGSVVIACGGMSYPKTGSTGDGYGMAKELGHTIIKPAPALVPIELIGNLPLKLKGVSLGSVGVKAVDKNNRKIYQGFGDIIFTHYGISGPAILSASSYMTHTAVPGGKIMLDLFPEFTDMQIDALLWEFLTKSTAGSVEKTLKKLHLPSRFIDVLVQTAGIAAGKKSCEATKQERKQLALLLKNFEMRIKSLRPMEEAMVTSGGVCVDEINPRTMESRIVKGLFFAGEVMDVDADTGGYNLQIAFSTGYVAGISCYENCRITQQ